MQTTILSCHETINRYLGTNLNNHDNCIYVKITQDEHLQKLTCQIGVDPLAAHTNSYKSAKNQINLLNALQEAILFKPISYENPSDRFLKKVEVLSTKAISTIFWIINKDLFGKEIDHISLLSEALKVNIENFHIFLKPLEQSIKKLKRTITPLTLPSNHFELDESAPALSKTTNAVQNVQKALKIQSDNATLDPDDSEEKNVARISGSNHNRLIAFRLNSSPRKDELAAKSSLSPKKNDDSLDKFYPKSRSRSSSPECSVDRTLQRSKKSLDKNFSCSLGSNEDKEDQSHQKKSVSSDESEKSSLSQKLLMGSHILERKAKVKKNYFSDKYLAEMPLCGLELCRYIWLEKYLNNQSLKKIQSFPRFVELSARLEKNNPNLFHEIINRKVFAIPLIRILEEQISRMLKMFSDPRAFAEDIDRHIENIEISAHLNFENEVLDQKSSILQLQTLKKSAEEVLNYKIKAFTSIIDFLLGRMVKESNELYHKMSHAFFDCSDEFKPILLKWNSIVAEEMKESRVETFVFICTNFFEYLNRAENGEEKFNSAEKNLLHKRKRKLLQLLWVFNQESYSMPVASILQAFPEKYFAVCHKSATIQFHYYAEGKFEGLLKKSMIPAKDSNLGDFEIVVCNALSSAIEKVPLFSSKISIQINKISDRKTIPNYMLETFQKIGIPYTVQGE